LAEGLNRIERMRKEDIEAFLRAREWHMDNFKPEEVIF